MRNDLQNGRYFSATRSDSGENCTNEVLAELIQGALPDLENPANGPLATVVRLMGGELIQAFSDGPGTERGHDGRG